MKEFFKHLPVPADDEPTFTLRASDPAACAAIEAWADRHRTLVDRDGDAAAHREAKHVAALARAFASEMLRYNLEHWNRSFLRVGVNQVINIESGRIQEPQTEEEN